MATKTLSILMTVLLIGSVSLQAAESEGNGKKVYRTVDESGAVEFSDVPGKSAEEVTIPPAQTYKSTPVKPTTPVTASDETETQFRYEVLEIASPKNEETVFNNAGNVTVSFVVKPGVPKILRHKLLIYVDGKEQPGAGPQVQLSNLDRGRHTVKAKIVDPAGNVLKSSAETVFFMKRHSKLFPKPPLPPRKPPAGVN